MNKPMISIIIPIYNSEKYISDCINSCINQTYNNLEIILVDDGSVDNSLKICNYFATKDSRIKVIHQNNKGVSAARNTGIKNSTGLFVCFVDSDDEIYPNCIELLYEDIIKYNADIASAVYSTVDEHGIEFCRYNDGKIFIYKEIEPLLLSLKYDRQTNSACAKLFSRKIIDNVFFVEGKNINEDGYFIFQCYAKKPRLIQHNICVYKYFVRDQSSSRSVFTKKYFDMLFFSDLKKKYILKYHPNLIEYALNMEVSTHIFFLQVLCRDVNYCYKRETKKSISIVRKRFFKYKSINRQEKIFSVIVALGFYPLYKKLFIYKFYKKYKSNEKLINK